MSDTLVGMRTKVRRRLDEVTARFWNDTDLNDWINEAAREVARRAEVLQDTKFIDAVGGQQQYPMPTDVYRVHRVEFARSASSVQPLEYRDFNNMDSVWWSSQRTTPGDPYWFTMWGFPPTLSLIVYPTPSTSIAQGFKVFYYRMPATVAADSDTVEVPAGWDDVVLDYCEYSALRKDADPRWQEAKQLFEDKMNHMTDTTQRWIDSAGAVTAGNGALPRWIWDDGLGY
jgi:hypothetical protein